MLVEARVRLGKGTSVRLAAPFGTMRQLENLTSADHGRDVIMVAMRKLILGGVVLFVLMTPVVHTQATPEKIDVSTLGPQVGERVPDFSLKDQSGTTRTLQSIMGENGAMLVFARSADW